MFSRISVVVCMAALAATAPAQAQSTVECHSTHFQYNECQAPLRQPQLIHQISSSSCILNRSWGFNPDTRRIWVADGCAGVFADTGGYHHGRGDRYDRGARHYDDRGHDVGAITAGLVVAALLGAAASDSHRSHSHTTSNVDSDSRSGYTGCHGIGCQVDNPDRSQDIDTRPSFDKQGNPNFDTKGNWQGCHGAGCDVDPPQDDTSGNN